jgi:hypothetical protein
MRFLGCLALAGLAHTSLLSAGCSGTDSEAGTVRAPSATTTATPAAIVAPSTTAVPMPGGPTPRPTLPPFTEEQRATIRSLTASDPRFVALAAPHLADVDAAVDSAEIVPWTDGIDLVGGVITVTLSGSEEVGGEWLGMNWDEGSQPGTDALPYDSVPYEATFDGVTGIRVFVDLERSAVAGISPDGRGVRMLGGDIPTVTPVADCSLQPTGPGCR